MLDSPHVRVSRYAGPPPLRPVRRAPDWEPTPRFPMAFGWSGIIGAGCIIGYLVLVLWV